MKTIYQYFPEVLLMLCKVVLSLRRVYTEMKTESVTIQVKEYFPSLPQGVFGLNIRAISRFR